MKQHTNDFKNEIKLLGKQQSVKITYMWNDKQIIITDEEINSATPNFKANLLKSIMKEMDLDINVNIPEGIEIKFEYGLLVNGEYEYLDYGNYIVYSSAKKEDTSSYEIKCYDKLLYSMKKYEAVDVIYPCTIKEYLTAVCTKIGLSIKDNLSFANMNQILDSDLYENLDYTYRDVLDQIAQVAGGIICLTLDNKIEVKYINETNDVIDEEYINSTNVTFGEKYGPINSIVLSRSGESDNIYISDEQSVEENGLCEIKIIDNQIMNFNDRDKFLQELSEKLFGVEYYLNDFESTGVMYYDILDAYNVKIGANTYNCLMINDEQLITQGLAENIYTERPEQSETDYTKADKTDQRINQAYIIVDKQNKKIESLTSEVNEYSEKVSKVEQTVDGISQKVESIEEFSREIKSMQQVHLTDTAEGENLVLNLTIYGDTNKFKILTPAEDLVPSEDLVPYGDTIDLIVDTQPRTNPSENAETFEIDIGEPLRNVGKVRDELNIINNKVSITRRISNDLQVLEQEVIEEIGEVKIPTYKDNTYIYIREYPTLEYFCRYIIDNDYIKQFASQDEQDDLQQGMVELNTLIEQTNSEILLLARRKVGKDEVIASINLAPEEARIIAERIEFEGLVTANENFKIFDDGSMQAKNGKFIGGQVRLLGGTSTNPNFIIEDSSNTNRTWITPTQFQLGNPSSMNKVELSTNRAYIGNVSGFIQIDGGHVSITNELYVNGDIHAYSYKYDSLEEKKKDIEEYKENVIDKIKNVNIYKFRYKTENETKKQHIGFIINNNSNTPEELINDDTIDGYSMISMLWKGVQEQQKQIEEMQLEIKLLKENLKKV